MYQTFSSGGYKRSNSCGYNTGISHIYGGSPQSMYSSGQQSSSINSVLESYDLRQAKATKAEDYHHASPLELEVKHARPIKSQQNYLSKRDWQQTYLNKNKYTSSSAFLAPTRPQTPMIKNSSEIMPYIREAFEKLVGEKFPEDHLKIHILDDKEFEKAHGPGGKFGPGIQGFALNRQGKGINEVFVRKNHLDHLMLTLGHEIGHVMSKTLADDRDEEAKAFAFSVAWMKTIKENNIAGLAGSIMPNPARNGLHDVAYEYLLELINKGKGAWQLFRELADGAITITKKLEVVYL